MSEKQATTQQSRKIRKRPRQSSLGFADLNHYFVSPDAQRADFWHLQALCGLRRAMGDRPLSQAGYERVRAALDAELVVRRFGSLRTAHAWLSVQGFAPNAALRRWVHADGREAVIERTATSTRYVRIREMQHCNPTRIAS